MNTQAENSVSKISKSTKIFKNLEKIKKVQMKMVHQVVISGKIFFDRFKMHLDHLKSTLAHLIPKTYSERNLGFSFATCVEYIFCLQLIGQK